MGGIIEGEPLRAVLKSHILSIRVEERPERGRCALAVSAVSSFVPF
jgi:hypothetical protein